MNFPSFDKKGSLTKSSYSPLHQFYMLVKNTLFFVFYY